VRNGSSALYRMRGERSISSLSIAMIAADFRSDFSLRNCSSALSSVSSLGCSSRC
jgi:hypothetical protein